MADKIYFNKLIRDFVPASIKEAGDTCSVRKLTDKSEFATEIRRKIIEEATEMTTAKGREQIIKEYADLMVALDAFTADLEISEAEFTIAMKESVENKGLFKERNFLEWSAYKS